MELKKTPKADLKNKRAIFIQIGLICSIAICLYGFESTGKVKKTVDLGTLDNQSIVEEIIPITPPEEIKPVIPPPPKLADLILIAENDAELLEDLIKDSEVTNKTAITAVMQASSQKENDKDDDIIFIAVEDNPEFPGGYPALLKFLFQNVKYPSIAVENGITGKVTVSFVVNTDGSITATKILRGVDPALDKEALRVVNSMPKWKPGKQAGKTVRVAYSVPINFVLSN